MWRTYALCEPILAYIRNDWTYNATKLHGVSPVRPRIATMTGVVLSNTRPAAVSGARHIWMTTVFVSEHLFHCHILIIINPNATECITWGG